jgi:molecular chaperone GrpE (heat shock protein)
VADQVDEEGIAIVAAVQGASDQIVPILYERLVDGFRREGQRVEVVQIKVSREAESESITTLGGEGYDVQGICLRVAAQCR